MSVLVWESVAEPEAPFVSCHCSVIQELENGELLAGYYAGEGEAKPDAAWVLARKAPGAERFGPLFVVADTPGKPEGNGILFQNAHGKLLLIYGTMHGKLDGPPGPGVRWVTCDLRMKTSEDGGRRWSEVRMIEPEWGHVPRCKPVRLQSGEIIFGTEFKDGHSRLWISGDEGESWRMTGPVPGERNQHPSLIEREDGSILALLRPSGRQGRVLWSESADGGETWAPAQLTGLASPFAALDAVRLSDGRVALAWNDSEETRNPLTLALSEDGGRSWVCRRNLVTGEGQFHYPALIEGSDGLLHLSFTNNRRTIDHIALTVEWIEGKGDALPAWEGSGRRFG